MTIEVVTWQQLVERAGSQDRARTLLRIGVWRRVVRNAYVEGFLDDSPLVRLAALRAVLPDGAALSHRTALWVLGCDVLTGSLDVTVPRGRRVAARPGLRIHIAALPDSELVEYHGVLLTSAARAVVDVARTEPLAEAVAFGDAALRCGATTPLAIEASLETAGALRGVRAAVRAVPLLNGRSQSPMESRLRIALHLGGVPDKDVQHDVYDDGGHAGRTDLHVEGVAVEYDGRASRLGRAPFTDDRRRQNRICDTAMEVRRFTSRDYYGCHPRQLGAVVLRAVRIACTRDRSRLRSGPDTLPKPRLRPLPTRAERAAASV